MPADRASRPPTRVAIENWVKTLAQRSMRLSGLRIGEQTIWKTGPRSAWAR